MARSHWAFLASAMYSRWEFMSIRRHREWPSPTFAEGSAKLRRCCRPSGSIGMHRECFNVCIEIFATHSRRISLKECRRIIPDASPNLAEASPNSRRFFVTSIVGDASPTNRRCSARLRRSFAEALPRPHVSGRCPWTLSTLYLYDKLIHLVY